MTEVREKQKIVRGDSVLLPGGTVHEILKIQEVHNRYQLRGVSGWKYGIETLVLRPPGEAYRYWQDQATAEKERADRLESELETAYNEVEKLQKEYARLDETAASDYDQLTAAEAREKKLREAIEQALSWTWDCGENNMFEVISILQSAIHPLEKEGETK